jgi:hypothetical protein
MRALIIGDVHGDFTPLHELLLRAKDALAIDAAFQVGDFGLYPELIGERGEWLPPFPLPLHIACGNHEDHGWLQRCLRAGIDQEWCRRNCYYQPRGSVLLFGGSRIGFLGGALNIDRPQRGRRKHGTTNYIIEEQRLGAEAVFEHCPPDLLITHSCPSGIGIGMSGNPALAADLHEHVIAKGFDPGPRDDAGEVHLRQLWQNMSRHPRAWAFGHFHYRHQRRIDDCDFVCAGLFEAAADALIWDSTTLTLSTVPITGN